jgi:hypothetical protein
MPARANATESRNRRTKRLRIQNRSLIEQAATVLTQSFAPLAPPKPTFDGWDAVAPIPPIVYVVQLTTESNRLW